MTGVNVPTLKAMRLENISDLAGSPAPCITVLLPPYRPGDQIGSIPGLLKTYCQEIARQLALRHIPETEAEDLIEPLLRLTSESVTGWHSGRAIFRSPEIFTMLDGLEAVKPAFTVGRCFQIRPVLAALNLPREVYLLKLSQKQVELLKFAGGRAESVPLPKAVPRTLDEALEFKPPDHDLENRSTAGASVGSMRGVRFGTGTGREVAQTYLSDFYKVVDRGVWEVVRRDAPLVLAGVDQDTALYRSVSDYPNLLNETIHGGVNSPISGDELLRRVEAIVRRAAVDRNAAKLAEVRERMAPARFAADLDTILRAAADKRVDSLYLNQDAQAVGVFGGDRLGGRANWGEEDLLNVAAIETFLHGGDVFALPAAKMPQGLEAAAVLRY